MGNKIFDILYSLYFNYRYLPFSSALKLPIRICRHVKVKRLKRGSIIFDSKNLHVGMIRLGINDGSFSLARNKSSIYIEDNCKLVFTGTCFVDGGFTISINREGKIYIGQNVHFNANVIISSSSLIKICDNVGTGWNCTFIDWDGHDIIDLETKKIINCPRPIIIGENCWIGANVTIMKGTELCNNIIVPYGSVITKKCNEPFCVFGGSPNHVLKNNIARKDKL